MPRPSLAIAGLALLFAHLAAPPLRAQGQITPLTPSAEQRPGGWSVTPSLDYAFVWDSNVLFENVGSEIVGEGLHMVKPNGVVAFRDRRTEFDLQYNGAFVQHPTLSSLNSYDQRLAINAMRQWSRRTSWFLRHSATIAPTTELVELVGVPFTRLGVHRQDVRTGVESLLGRNTTLATSYRFQWVDFKPTADDVLLLAGGHNHGLNVSLGHALSRRVSVTGEYDVQRATVTGGGEFDIQNSWGGFEYRFSEFVQASGSVGVSRLSGAEGVPARIGPSIRVGLARRTPSAEVGVLFNKSYAPNYGFGGTTDNEELTARLRVPVGRRLTANASVSFRRNEPLNAGDGFFLRSLWFYGSVGYLVNDWMRVEAFSASARQLSDQPDGRINRYQLGIQITAVTTARIR
jgi:hypothetical protein